MAAEEYFNLRQSTRAYQNPYEAGGVGVGGLTASARYNRQQVGSSFLSAPSGTNTWSGRSGAGGGGGYVSMPSVGPTPVSRDIERAKKQGPSGPEAFVTGSAGNFGQQNIAPFDPQWNTTRAAAVPLAAAGTAIAGRMKKRKDRKERESIEAEQDWDNNRAWVKRDQELDEGVVVRTPSRAEAEDEYLIVGGRSFGRRPSTKYDPSLAGSGADIDDINLKYGLPSVRAIGALGPATPSAERQWRSEEQGPPVRPLRPTSNVYEGGPIPVAPTRALEAGPASGTYVAGQGDEGPARVVGGIPTRNPQDRPSEESLEALRQRTGGTPPPTNPRLGARLGRNATRGERRAAKDPNQGGLFDPDEPIA